MTESDISIFDSLPTMPRRSRKISIFDLPLRGSEDPPASGNGHEESDSKILDLMSNWVFYERRVVSVKLLIRQHRGMQVRRAKDLLLRLWKSNTGRAEELDVIVLAVDRRSAAKTTVRMVKQENVRKGDFRHVYAVAPKGLTTGRMVQSLLSAGRLLSPAEAQSVIAPPEVAQKQKRAVRYEEKVGKSSADRGRRRMRTRREKKVAKSEALKEDKDGHHSEVTKDFGRTSLEVRLLKIIIFVVLLFYTMTLTACKKPDVASARNQERRRPSRGEGGRIPVLLARGRRRDGRPDPLKDRGATAVGVGAGAGEGGGVGGVRRGRGGGQGGGVPAGGHWGQGEQAPDADVVGQETRIRVRVVQGRRGGFHQARGASVQISGCGRRTWLRSEILVPVWPCQ